MPETPQSRTRWESHADWSYEKMSQTALSEGVSAADMSRELRGYLKNPDRLFRRVRDERGNLTLSRNARLFHPGQGVYRSSYMNARRLAATETNMAYRSADYERWKSLDFVVGVEIQTSNNHTTKDSRGGTKPLEDICDTLAGRYPKGFKFVGWHPHCRCIATTILKTEEEMEADTERIMNGEEPLSPDTSGNYIGELPDRFTKWLDTNSERIENAKSLPYFLKDNEELINGATANAGGGSNGGGGNTLAAGGGGDGKPPVNNNGNGGGVAVGGDDDNDNGNNGNNHRPATVKEVEDAYDTFCGDEDSYRKWDNFDFVGVRKQMEEIMNKYGIRIGDSKVDITKEGFEISFKSDEKIVELYPKYTFSIERSFKIRGDGSIEVHHDLFDLAKKYQGQGISKEVFRMLYEQYGNVGVRYITVYANLDIGGYTWARYGFSASRTKIAELISSTNRLSDSARQNTLDFIKDYYDSHNLGNDEPFPMNKLVDYWGREEAKRILKGISWHGEIDLTDDEQRKIFEEYMGYKKKDK